jgi:hypothetical protein
LRYNKIEITEWRTNEVPLGNAKRNEQAQVYIQATIELTVLFKASEELSQVSQEINSKHQEKNILDLQEQDIPNCFSSLIHIRPVIH